MDCREKPVKPGEEKPASNASETANAVMLRSASVKTTALDEVIEAALNPETPRMIDESKGPALTVAAVVLLGGVAVTTDNPRNDPNRKRRPAR